MRNPAFTARHGKPWTRLPADQLAAVGADPAMTEVGPPGLDAIAAAQEPGRVITAKASHDLSRVSTTFDETNLVPNAGLLPAAVLAQRIDLAGLGRRASDVGRARGRTAGRRRCR
jgi:hypothetical protein